MTDIYAPMPPGFTRATDMSAQTYDRSVVSLVDLVRPRLASREMVVRNLSFTNCVIEGPAVMLVVGGCQFDACDFGNPSGDIRNLVLRPASPSAVIGAIPVQDCRFRNCQFVGIGYTGGDHFLDQILSLGQPQ